jgi:hypothetical protein
MYTLGDYNRALVRLTSDDGEHTRTLELERAAGRLVIRDGREGREVFGVALEDDGTLRAFTWPDGEEAAEVIDVEPCRHKAWRNGRCLDCNAEVPALG